MIAIRFQYPQDPDDFENPQVLRLGRLRNLLKNVTAEQMKNQIRRLNEFD